MKYLAEVQPLSGYPLCLRLEDGEAGEIDLSVFLRFDGVFAPIRDPDRFAEVRVHPSWARSAGRTAQISIRSSCTHGSPVSRFRGAWERVCEVACWVLSPECWVLGEGRGAEERRGGEAAGVLTAGRGR